MTTNLDTMRTIRTKDAAIEFLDNRRIAVTGVSRSPQAHGGNVVYRRLRDRGYDVVAINPNAKSVEGDTCWATLRDLPDPVDAVVIATSAAHAEETVAQCIELGIKHVWMHRAFGEGSVSNAAVDLARRAGLQVIDGGCPCMYPPTSDAGHRVMRSVLTLTGSVPRRVGACSAHGVDLVRARGVRQATRGD